MKRKTHKREVASDSSRIKTELQNELVFAKNAGNRKAPVLMTPQIASQIEEKSREWEKVVKMFLMPNLPAKKYSLAENSFAQIGSAINGIFLNITRK